MPEVIVLGSANVDFTVRADRLPRPCETVTGGDFMVSFGGKGANQALAALKAGAGVVFLSRIGRDTYGDLLYEHLVEEGLDPAGLLRDPEAPAGVALIAVDRAGNNQIIIAPGSNKRFTVEDVRSLEPLLEKGSILLAQLEIPLPTTLYALESAKSRGMTTILNPAPFVPLPTKWYPFIDILTPNEREASDLTGIEVIGPEDAERAASVLCSRGCPTVIITLGAQGSLLGHGEAFRLLPPFQVDAVDSVAAGDAFNGALAAALGEHQSLAEAVHFANAAGALCTTKRGAQESLPVRGEIERLLAAGSQEATRP
jgi:ribokinase